MKKAVCITLLLALVASLGFAKGPYKDGFYVAMEDGYTHGWKYIVQIEVEKGDIVWVDWDGVSSDAGPTKDVVSTSGKYPIVDAGGAQAPWHIQGERAEAWLIESQKPSMVNYIDEDGHTDTITGVSIHVIEFFELVDAALKSGPTGRGPYRDGYYSASMPEFERGLKYFVEITVVGGYIVAVDWDALSEEDTRTKDQISADGDYPIVENGGAQAPWHVQGERAENWLIENQDPSSITYIDDEGHTDVITGVSIHVIEMFELVEKALTWAK